MKLNAHDQADTKLLAVRKRYVLWPTCVQMLKRVWRFNQKYYKLTTPEFVFSVLYFIFAQ